MTRAKAKIDPNSEYQRRLDVWARQVAAEQGPDWIVSEDAHATWQHSPAWACGEDTCGEDEQMYLMLANRYVTSFTLSDLPTILAGIAEVKLPAPYDVDPTSVSTTEVATS